MYLIEAVNLLEQLPKVQTDMPDALKQSIADAVAAVKLWMS